MKMPSFWCLDFLWQITTTDMSFFPSTRLPFFTEHTHDVKPRHCDFVQAPPMPFTVVMARFLSPVLSAQFMTPMPTLILNLTSCWSLSWTSSCPGSLPAVGYALLTSCRSALSRSGCSFLPAVGPLFSSVGGSCWVLLWTPLCSRLSGPVSALRRRHLRAPNSHYPVQCEALVTSRTWLSTCWPTCSSPHVLSRAARGLGDPSPTLRKTPHSKHCAWR